MDLVQSLILGIVEGITEFLPISSTGHMILTSYLLKINGPVVDAFEVFIQLGAILAVVFLYRHRFIRLADFKSRDGFSGFRGLTLLAITSLPILLVGKVFEHTIKSHLFNPFVVSCALAIGGVVLLIIERVRFRHDIDSLEKMSYKDALMIGLFQCAALCPGVSRAASTIIGGLSTGLKRTVAAEYSFLAAVPIMFIVCIKDLLGIWSSLSSNDITAFAVGFLVAFVSAIFAVKSFIHLLQKTSLAPFGIYRIVIAIVFFILLQHHPLQ